MTLATEPAVVHVRVADMEPLRSFIKGVTEAAGMFATLGEGEQDGLPDAALFGIARLRGAIAELTGEAPPSPAGEPEQFRGVVIIEWPAPAGVPPYSAMNASKCDVTDAVTGKPVITCTRIEVRAAAGEIVTASLTMFADEDGNPILDGEPVVKDGEYLTGTFPFAVAGMRVRGEPVA